MYNYPNVIFLNKYSGEIRVLENNILYNSEKDFYDLNKNKTVRDLVNYLFLFDNEGTEIILAL